AATVLASGREWLVRGLPSVLLPLRSAVAATRENHHPKQVVYPARVAFSGNGHRRQDTRSRPAKGAVVAIGANRCGAATASTWRQTRRWRATQFASSILSRRQYGNSPDNAVSRRSAALRMQVRRRCSRRNNVTSRRRLLA